MFIGVAGGIGGGNNQPGVAQKSSQVTYVTMVPRMGNETLRPLGVATGNASA